MHKYKLTYDIYGYLVNGNHFIEFLSKEYSAYRIGFVVVFSFWSFHELYFIFLIENVDFTIINNYTIYYTQMIESLEACVDGKPIRIIE